MTIVSTALAHASGLAATGLTFRQMQECNVQLGSKVPSTEIRHHLNALSVLSGCMHQDLAGKERGMAPCQQTTCAAKSRLVDLHPLRAID